MTTYSHPDDRVLALAHALMATWNPDAHEAHVRVGVLFASDSEGGPALKHGGYPAAAIVSVVPLVQRMYAPHDALIRVSAQAWEGLSEDGQSALLAHELRHLAVERRPASVPGQAWWKTDDLGRPRLRLVPGDWHGGDGFAAVVAHYGEAALELKNLHRARAVA